MHNCTSYKNNDKSTENNTEKFLKEQKRKGKLNLEIFCLKL